jgi:hypothetical protein
MFHNVSCLAGAFRTISDPRSKQGTNLPFTGLLALVFLGLRAGQNYFAPIYRWATDHWSELKTPLGFKENKPPHATTLSQLLAKIRLCDLQEAFVIVLSQVLKEQPLIPSASEVHYYISSPDLSQHQPENILALVRGHWSIENCLHLVKDRW